MYKLNDVNFLNFCVDMSDPNQGQPIDPSKLPSGRRARQNTHLLKRGKGRGQKTLISASICLFFLIYL